MRALGWVVALLVVLGLAACGPHNGATTSTSPSASSSASASSSDQPSQESSASSEAASTQPSPTQPAADATITAENNQDFAALLADPNGDCDNNTKGFAKKYWDSTIEFDGKIASIASHNGDTYVQDVLVYDGKAATAFQFNGVTIQPGGHAPAALGLPANSQPLAEGDKVHIVAKVDDFNQTQCLFHLMPVSTKIIS